MQKLNILLIYYPFTVNVDKLVEAVILPMIQYVRVCVLEEVKKVNAKVFNLMSRVTEIQHES